MAHWIIEDHGFGGQTYRCSDCREAWNDIYDDVSMAENCPKCGAPIDEDATEYVEEKKKKTNNFVKFLIPTPYSEQIRLRDELEHKLIQVSGFDVEKLIELFAAGYTLEPPKRESLHEMRII